MNFLIVFFRRILRFLYIFRRTMELCHTNFSQDIHTYQCGLLIKNLPSDFQIFLRIIFEGSYDILRIILQRLFKFNKDFLRMVLKVIYLLRIIFPKPSAQSIRIFSKIFLMNTFKEIFPKGFQSHQPGNFKNIFQRSKGLFMMDTF